MGEKVTKHFIKTQLARYFMSAKGTYVGKGFETFGEKDGAVCSIGDWCSIGIDVKVHVGGYHHADWVTTSPIAEDGISTYAKGNVEICSDVWIGNCAVIMSGVRVGYGAVVAAHSVVTRNVPDYAIVGGNPAKLIRYRFTEAQIAALLQIRWWEWPEATVRANWQLFCQPDIDKFIKTFLPGGNGENQ